MTATISPPVRILAVLGVLAAVGAAVFFLLLGRLADEPAVQPSSIATRATASTPAEPAILKPATRPAAPARTAEPAVAKSGLPLAIDRALRTRKVAVVAVYVPGAGVDAAVRREARAGAVDAGAAFLSVPATNARVLGPLVAKAGVLPAPAVVVVRRPGVIATTFGVTDRELVAQAVRQAKQ